MNKEKNRSSHPVGYTALIANFGLAAIPHWHRSSVGQSTVLQAHNSAGQMVEVYPRALMPQETLGGQLEFALKYDGTNLEILSALFDRVSVDELVAYIGSKPMGKYTRRIWYLYELITAKRLPLDDLGTGNYVDLLEPEKYYTSTPIQVRRQRINDNLLGDARFCPVIRRTELLRSFESKDLSNKCREVLAAYPAILIVAWRRAPRAGRNGE